MDWPDDHVLNRGYSHRVVDFRGEVGDVLADLELHDALLSDCLSSTTDVLRVPDDYSPLKACLQVFVVVLILCFIMVIRSGSCLDLLQITCDCAHEQNSASLKVKQSWEVLFKGDR